MKYYTADREAGNRIDCFSTKEEAMKAIERYEQEDRDDGIYVENFYDVEEEPEGMDDFKFTKEDAEEFIKQLQDYIDGGGDNAETAQKQIDALVREYGVNPEGDE